MTVTKRPRRTIPLVAFVACAGAWPAHAADQPAQSGGALLGRDAAVDRPAPEQPEAPVRVAGPEPVPEMAPVATGTRIGALRVEGLAALTQADFADIAERHVGAVIDAATLQAIARAVAERARARGLVLASAAVPAQPVSLGILTVTLDEGAIEAVRIEGSDNPALKSLLTRLVGPPVRKEVLDRILQEAGQLPGITVRETRFLRERGSGILVVTVADRRSRGSIAVDNAGSGAFGPLRARLEFDLNGLIEADDRLSGFVLTTPAMPSELAYVSMRYENRLSHSGLTGAVTLAAGRTEARTAGIETEGWSQLASVSLSTPLLLSRDTGFWLSGELAYLRVDQDFIGFSLQRDDIVMASVTGSGVVRMGGGWLNGGIAFTQGLGILGATRAGDPASSRTDGSGRFSRLQAWLGWTGRLGGGYSLRLAGRGQLASRALLASQELGLGGPGFGRAYEFSERTGDRGIVGLVELRRQWEQPVKWLDWAQIYGFADGGIVGNLRGGDGGGSLFSAGGGVRAGKGPADLGLEIAAPLNADRFDTGDRSPRLNLQVQLRF